MVAGLTLGTLADSWGIPVAWIVTALILAVTSALYLRVESAPVGRHADRTPPVAASGLPID
jgi:uncharacterized membrane protein AbrB (regulator of aidB expression)